MVRNKFLILLPAIIVVVGMIAMSFSGPVSATISRQTQNGTNQANTFVVNGVSVTMQVLPNGYKATYNEGGNVTNVIVLNEGNGNFQFSVNNGAWQHLNVSAIAHNFMVANSAKDSASSSVATPSLTTTTGGGGGGGTGTTSSSSPTIFWWYSTEFEKGYPVVYPHPDYSYYQIYTENDWGRVAGGMWNEQIGSNIAGPLRDGGDTAIGGAIGAIMGAAIGGAIGAAIGAAVGAIIGTVLAIVANFVAFDGSGSVWFWFNSSVWNSLFNIPWYVYLLSYAGIAAWIWDHVSYFRVGNYTFNNSGGYSNP